MFIITLRIHRNPINHLINHLSTFDSLHFCRFIGLTTISNEHNFIHFFPVFPITLTHCPTLTLLIAVIDSEHSVF